MPRAKRSRAPRVTGDVFASVIRAFQASAKFRDLARATRVNYAFTFRLAERPDTLGAIPIDQIRPALVQAFLDGFSDRPGRQKNAQTALKSLEKWAVVRDLLPYPITTGTEAAGSTGGREPWTDAQVETAERHARKDLAHMVTLAANTGQRGSDLVRMRWTDIEDYQGRPGINITQYKTGLVIWVPFTQELMAAIRTWERRPGYLVLKPDGLPFTRPQLSDNWLRERGTNPALKSLDDARLSMHGLRATAVIRLRRAGATTGEIASMVGMSEPMVNRYCRLSKQKDNALAAVYRMDGTRQEPDADKSSETAG
jgi:integrase